MLCAAQGSHLQPQHTWEALVEESAGAALDGGDADMQRTPAGGAAAAAAVAAADGGDEAAVAARAVGAARQHAEAVRDEAAALARLGAEGRHRHAIQKVPVATQLPGISRDRELAAPPPGMHCGRCMPCGGANKQLHTLDDCVIMCQSP